MSQYDLLPGPVTWHRTGDHQEDLPILDAWCAAVGPAVVAGPSMPDMGPFVVLDSLVVVTWNVHVGGGDVVRLVDDLRNGVFTDGRRVEDFVLLLQEAHRTGVAVPQVARSGFYPERIHERPPSGERIDVLETAQRLGLHVLYVPSMRNGEGGGLTEDRGNAILSTVPLTGTAAIELPYEAQRRVAVAGTVRLQNGEAAPLELRLVSAHLDNRSRLTRFLATFGSGRARQARALAEAVGDPHAIVGADLNTWSAGFLEAAVDVLRLQFPDTPPAPDATYHAAGVLPRKLDHLLVRLPEGWSASVRRAGVPYGSDHFPLIGLVHRTS